MTMRPWLPLIVSPLLAGCINETASLRFDGPEHALILQARQAWFWQPVVDLEVVMSRPPDCQRRSRLDAAAAAEVGVEVLRPDAGEFVEPILILRQGARHYAVSTRNCEMQPFAKAPEKTGTLLGTFRLEAKKLKFVAAPVPTAPAVATPATPPAGRP